MATIKDVAKLSGVSVATVSRVLNNRGYLSNDVKKKVASAIKELDYQPNDLARSLNRQKSNILGLIVPTVSHPFFGEVARMVEFYAHNNGYKLLICNSLQDKAKEQEYINMLKRSQVDGIVMGSHLLDIEDYMGLNLPICSLDRQLSDTIPYVCCDNYQGGALATKHLRAAGCKKLLHISGSLEITMLSNQRTDAFLDVCRETGTPYAAYELPDSSVINFNGEEYLRDILQENPDCDGVFATSDITAAMIVSIALSINRSVPKDLKVIGFDGSLISTLTFPKISSILQPLDAICRYIVEYLIRQIGGETVPNQTILPITLLEKDSTKRD
jgi:LacI family sucrose operon transcriptional repressor